MNFKPNTIILCNFCGSKGKTKLCNSCSTRDQRRKKIEQQLEIDSENLRKGRKISDRLFMFDRNALMKEYGLA